MTELHHRLTNWARWARDHNGSIGHCASIEHRYRSPQHWWPEDARIEVDLADALAVEREVRALPLAMQKPFVLYVVRFRQVKNHDGGMPLEVKNIILRILAKQYKIAINRNRLWDVVLDAHHFVFNRLTAKNQRGKVAGENLGLMPDSIRDYAPHGARLSLKSEQPDESLA